MNWDYIAGYGDGEACLILAIHRDKREKSIRGSQVDGWGIQPNWTITSYDFSTQEKIAKFLKRGGYDVRTPCLEQTQLRQGHTKIARRLSMGGWGQLVRFAQELIPRTEVKRKQFELLLELRVIIDSKLKTKKKRSSSGAWTKELFIKAMEKVDEINSLKSRQRGKYNAQFFKELWKEELGL